MKLLSFDHTNALIETSAWVASKDLLRPNLITPIKQGNKNILLQTFLLSCFIWCYVDTILSIVKLSFICSM